MKRTFISVLIGVLGISLACAKKGDDLTPKTPSAPKVTREYLLAHGFKELADAPGTFKLEHVRLRDVLRDIGVSPKSLCPTPNGEYPNDLLTAETSDINVIVRPEVPREKSPVDGSLVDPDAICAVDVSFPGPKHEFLKTDSTPHLHVKSVVVQSDRSKPLAVTLEISADGSKPVAVLQSDFSARLRGGNTPPVSSVGFLFPETTPQEIVVFPGKPLAYELSIPTDVIPGVRLSSGKYVLCIGICAFKGREPQRFDYEWEGEEYWSNEYRFTIGKEPAGTIRSGRSAPKVTRAYLLARGFKESADQSGVFTLEHVRLRDVSRDLGFPLASLRPIRSQARVNEELTADVSGMSIIVESEVPYSKSPMDGLLDNPDTICTVTVAISTGTVSGGGTGTKEYLQTESTPRLHITSVLVPKRRTMALKITFEFAADGKTPLAAEQGQFQVELFTAKKSIVFVGDASFPKNTPQPIDVNPGKPVTLTVTTARNTISHGSWSDLPSGQYFLRIAVNGTKDPDFDYQWTGERFSDEYKLTIKWAGKRGR
jgi:hypothetical protein